MESRRFTSEDLNILIKAVDYAYGIVEEEHDDDLTKSLYLLKTKLKLIEKIGLGTFTVIEAEIIKSAVHLYILNSLSEHNLDEASRALVTLNKLPE